MRMLATPVALATLAAGTALAADERRIADLQKSPGITITGTATHVFGNSFVLQDATGTALVETGPEWFKRREFKAGEKLTVTGESNGSKFEAWRIVRADGSVEKIRDEKGPPPWAGKRRDRD